ncbi:MAG: hypothetical protein ACLUVF_11820 [Adlercreutzia sp.]
MAVPATFMLKEHDLTYRLNGADIKAIIATSAGDIAGTIDAVVKECPSVEALSREPAGAGLTPRDQDGTGCSAGSLSARRSRPRGHLRGPRRARGWRDFNSEVRAAVDFTARDNRRRSRIMTSPRAPGQSQDGAHDSGYALAHLVTAKHWHNVNEGCTSPSPTPLGQGGLGQVLRPVAHGAAVSPRLRPLRSADLSSSVATA